MSHIMRYTDTDSVMVIICNLILIKFDPTFNILSQVGVQWKVESLVFANSRRLSTSESYKHIRLCP